VKSQSAGSPLLGDYVRVRVSDSGVGMSADVLRQVFDPFFTTKKSGTGLGIPQVCAFMRQVGGHLSVGSEQGVGTNLDLFFPAAERDRELQAGQAFGDSADTV
jgi:signal transduction histidine kinase